MKYKENNGPEMVESMNVENEAKTENGYDAPTRFGSNPMMVVLVMMDDVKMNSYQAPESIQLVKLEA